MLEPTIAPFQFHKGTIKTQLATKISNLFGEFQFHKGTIKTPGRNP